MYLYFYFWSRVSGVTTLRRPCGIEYCGCVCVCFMLIFVLLICLQKYEYEYVYMFSPTLIDRLSGLRKNSSIFDFQWWKGGTWAKEETIRFWWHYNPHQVMLGIAVR